jgi:uncharacterized Zn finger protein
MNQPQIDPSMTLAVKCDECEGEKFRHALFIRKLSSLVSPDGKEHIIPVDVFECTACGHVNDSLNPLKFITK